MQIDYRTPRMVTPIEAKSSFDAVSSVFNSQEIAKNILFGYLSGIHYRPTQQVVVLKVWKQPIKDAIHSFLKTFDTDVYNVGKSLPSSVWSRPVTLCNIESYYYKKELASIAKGDNFIIREKGTEFPKCDKRLSQLVVLTNSWQYPKTQQFVEFDIDYINQKIVDCSSAVQHINNLFL